MIAEVQYNDLRGTAAADVSDFYNNSLQDYLSRTYETYDSERYSCLGCTIWALGQTENPDVSISFICWDKKEHKHIQIRLVKPVSLQNAFQLFKRFEVVMGIDINEVEIDNDDTLMLE